MAQKQKFTKAISGWTLELEAAILKLAMEANRTFSGFVVQTMRETAAKKLADKEGKK